VDRETAQLLRVEAYEPDDWTTKAALEEDLAGGRRQASSGPTVTDDGYQVQKITTTYDVVENGMRFPGLVEIVRNNSKVYVNGARRKAREREVLRVKQVYSNYRFYGVRTEEEIRGLVDPD
jgi:hypothetical protein